MSRTPGPSITAPTAISAAAGVLIGIVTTDGSTPWTYNFSSFQEV